MIALPEVAKKLQELLNHEDNPSGFNYVVETTGFHLDSIANVKEGRNFIPVFISQMGGTVNPVPELKQTDCSIPITFYFPVRFKESMFILNGYLEEVFVGKIIDYGQYTKKALSNISLPSYGEIQDLDVKQFKEWVDSKYSVPIEVMEPYISMTINLYLNRSDEKFIYGNAVKITNLKIYQVNDELGTSTIILDDDSPINIERADIASSEPAVQQLFSKYHSSGYPANASYTKELPIVIKNTSEYYDLLKICEVDQNVQSLKLVVTEHIPIQKTIIVDGEEVVANQYLETQRTYFATNYSRRTALGQLLGISFTLTDRQEEEVNNG